ncbi:hypothetical protein UB32_04850 [Mesobacillus subterraneus]|uniref:Uncharacterized protein n=1 Tax=Mesobacillus subterraneus TaxID=285983 RepID=A0A0D6ZEP7_9BACI|nr:hypothetical protein UB32_04850 [Mesobacillus subterraneus]
MNRNKKLQVTIFLLLGLLLILLIHVILHTKVYVVFSASLGSVFLIGLILFLILYLYVNR